MDEIVAGGYPPIRIEKMEQTEERHWVLTHGWTEAELAELPARFFAYLAVYTEPPNVWQLILDADGKYRVTFGDAPVDYDDEERQLWFALLPGRAAAGREGYARAAAARASGLVTRRLRRGWHTAEREDRRRMEGLAAEAEREDRRLRTEAGKAAEE
jgi:hypothetical protein